MEVTPANVGDGQVAMALLEQQAEVGLREHVLGPDHPDTVTTRRALAELAAEGEGLSADA